MKAYKAFFLLLGLVMLPVWAAQAQQKYALVIGNGAYTNITRLNNPVNDAHDMSAALQGLGFQVDTVLNGSRIQMEEAVERLRNRLGAHRGAYGFLFYAGHGVQSSGGNYLIPIDADIRSESYLRDRAVSVQAMLDELNQAGNALNIVVLDACRDNPFGWGRGSSRGLQVVGNQPADSIIVYATSAGSIAADGEGRNGLFTGQLLKNLKTPGLEVREIFRRTHADVRAASRDAQRPAVYDQFGGLAYLGAAASAAAPATVVMAPQAPRNVRAGTPGTDSVSLSWDSAGSGISYQVYYSNQNDPSGAKPLGNPTSTPSFNVNSMVSGTAYYFWVASVQDGQESGKSPVVTVRTAAIPVNPVPDGFVRINGGTFTMGSPASEAERYNDEGPQHQVRVSSFYMGKYEVTQKEWVAVMGSNPSKWKGDNLPVEQVSWYDAIDYCNRRSQREGLTPAYTRSGDTVTWNRGANGYRLPTEAEWEYACRAGTTGPFNTGNNITTNQANMVGGAGSTKNVGSFAPNAWGLYDMHGNVYEWCWDWFGTYTSGAQTDPAGAASGSSRVLRGGCWFYSAGYLRSANRYNITPSDRYSGYGFRLVRP
ncbi:MAG: SUMF1/EgtB/PvdO family nonheme iron enzyme [Treponema sp.]|jgi:formylglycine-generating enzyme required for sulfatase activity|nr:SUMF1/EgtB/PvdO family nonheme iron enzyme [Treponema sp.]